MDWTCADERQKVLDQAIDGIGGAMDGEEWTLDEDKILQVKRLGVTRTSYLQNDLMPNEPDLPGAIGFRALQMRKSISLIADTLRAGKPADDDDDDLWRHVVHTLDVDYSKRFGPQIRVKSEPVNMYNWRENELRDTLPDVWLDKPTEEKGGYGAFGNEVLEDLRQRKFEPKIVFNGIPIEGQHGVTDGGIVEVATHYRRKLIALGLLSPGIEDEV